MITYADLDKLYQLMTKEENEETIKKLKPWEDAIDEYLRKKKNK